MIRKIFLLTLALFSISGCQQSSEKTPSFKIFDAKELKFAVPTDSGCPAHWDNGNFYIFSSSRDATRLSGTDIFHLDQVLPVAWDIEKERSRWIEATYKAPDGTLYGWYHHEMGPICKERLPDKWFAAAIIGEGKSYDNGATWQDLGFTIQSDPNTYHCDTLNKYFPGGNGDFAVVNDQKNEYIYFFISTYGDFKEQGISVARMRYADLEKPVGKVYKWYNGKWQEPGLCGKVTPIFPAFKDWHGPSPDSFWGPSVHWNTYLKTYVMLLNRAIDPNWWQEGIYISFNKDLSNPQGWSKPLQVRKDGSWYPLVVGTDKKKEETDKLAGRRARYFEQGVSLWEIQFYKPGEKVK
ncbi:MAG: hypothetical protein ABFD79_14275 [Phycisphaerales bacterium]